MDKFYDLAILATAIASLAGTAFFCCQFLAV